MLQKIVFTGPESTGKSTLAKQLAAFLAVPYIPEYGREYLERLNRPYTRADLLEIAKGQLEKEEEAINKEPTAVICDTSFLVLKIWSEVKFGACDPYIEKLLLSRPGSYYFLCYPDLPWEQDPLREHPTQRFDLWERYHKYLTYSGMPFKDVKGTGVKRFQFVQAALREIPGLMIRNRSKNINPEK